LPAILSGLRERGFRFMPLSELMRAGGPSAGPFAAAPVEAHQAAAAPAATAAVP
jgi:hypothetical protein